MASGDASLAGAEFTFRYYDGQYATAAETEASGAPTRTWAFKTNEKGRIRIMDESLKVSGDDLFYNSMGQITLPIGTLLIQETKAPEGYLIDPTVYVRNITPDGTLEAVNSYNAPTVSEQVVTGRIQIVKHTDTGTTKVETPEVGATFNIYLASAGSYDAAPANARAQLTIDKDGFAVSPDLPYGLYTVEQTSGWEGSRLMEPFTVKIDENGKTYSYIINNERFYSYLKVVKVDAITGEAIPAAGIGFQIIDPQGQKLEWWGADTWYTDGSGVMKLPCELEYGRGYQAVEVVAPSGYVLADKPFLFDVLPENAAQEDGLTVITLTAPNSPTQISVAKVDYQGNFVPGATLQLLDKDGNVAAQWVTENTPHTLYGLPIGAEYTLHEAAAPEGWLLADDVTFIVQDTAEVQTMSKKTTKAQAVDARLFQQIQPHGGITFADPSYTRMGDGYCRCLHIYGLPNTLDRHWLTRIFTVSGCICSFDVATEDMAAVKRSINRSIGEEGARAYDAKDYNALYDAQKRQAELQQLYDELERMGEVMKICDFRIFLQAQMLAELEEKTKELQDNLDASGYKNTVLLGEQKTEWQSLYEPFAVTHAKPVTMKGLSLTARQLAEGYPFDYSDLLDEQGALLGFTDMGGAVVFDLFSKTVKRKHYNAAVCGDMGSGKSTLLKKLFKQNASIGNYIRCFDVSGEFSALTLEFGGKIIRCSGSDGMLNPLEILRSGEDDYASYARHISKLQAFFRCINPSMSDQLLQELANYLREFYAGFDLVPADGSSVTGRAATDYPTLSQFREFLQGYITFVAQQDKAAETEVETAIHVEQARNLQILLGAVENLCSNYGRLFDGHTTISDITGEKIVTFDISTIKELGNVFTAQMQNLVSLCWDNAIAVGGPEKEKWESGAYAIEDITKFLILIDESHRWVNTSMPLILDMVTRYLREARKYFAGIVLASQSVRDYMPEGDFSGADNIRILFELCQYKFMFKQDSSAKEHIRRIFGEGMTFSQVESIPFLEQGENVLSIAGAGALQFRVWLSRDYEATLFSGGR